MKDLALGTVPGSHGSPIGAWEGFRRSTGELLRAPGSPKVIEKWPKTGLIRRISCFLVRGMQVGSF